MGRSNQQQKLHGGERGTLQKLFKEEKKPKQTEQNHKTLYLSLIEAIGYAVNFKTHESRHTSFRIHVINLKVIKRVLEALKC